jgi:hypothetical protein
LLLTFLARRLSPWWWRRYVPPKTSIRSVLRLLVTANVPSSILAFLMNEAIHSSETSVLTRVARHNIPESSFPRSHRHKNVISYISQDLVTSPSSIS